MLKPLIYWVRSMSLDLLNCLAVLRLFEACWSEELKEEQDELKKEQDEVESSELEH